MHEHRARASTPDEIKQFALKLQERPPDIVRAGVRAASLVGKWRLAANSAHGEQTDVRLTFFPNGSGRLKCAAGDIDFFWHFLDILGGLMIFPREVRYCQPGPSVSLRLTGQGTCLIQFSHDLLLPGGTHEFFKHRAEPVATRAHGKVLRLARSKWLIGTGSSLILAAVVLYWSMPGGTILDPLRAILGLLVATGGFVTCLRWLFPKNRRLVIGNDCVQLVDGKETVVGQLPYDQIASVHFFHGPEEEESFFYRPAVTVRVADLSRPDTFWPGTPNEQLEFVIQDRFVASPDEIRKWLRSRWQECKRRREIAETPPGKLAADVDMIG